MIIIINTIIIIPFLLGLLAAFLTIDNMLKTQDLYFIGTPLFIIESNYIRN